MLKLSTGEEDGQKMGPVSDAAKATDPVARAKEMLKQFADDRKKAAYAMRAEGYSSPEIGAAFKVATGTGIGGREWGEWKLEEEKSKQVGEVAVPVLAKEEKAWMAEVAAHFKTLSDRMQTYVIDFGVFVLETVTPQVPVESPEEKMRRTKEWLKDAVAAFDPEAMREIEKFGAAAFLAAQELKAQITALMMWADPSSRLQAMAEKALYSSNPINEKAFNMLMLELVKSIHAVPRFGRAERVSELPGIVKAYADARGVAPEEAEEIMGEVVQEVGAGE